MNARLVPFCLIALLGISFGTAPQTGQDDLIQHDEPAQTCRAPKPDGPDFQANLIVDNRMKVYADGVFVGFNQFWFLAQQFNMSSSTKVIAIEAKNFAGPAGIRASFDGDRLLTDGKQWYCQAKLEKDWWKPNYDDSHWPLAKEIQYTGRRHLIENKEIVHPDAKWIWTESLDDSLIFCRASFGTKGHVQVDDKMKIYADGVLVGESKKWHQTTEVNFPGHTIVVAIKGYNRKGPRGILTSIGDLVTGPERWRCSSRHRPAWQNATYNDGRWRVARIVRGPSRRSPTINSRAQFIWSSNKQNAYCRAYLNIFATLRVDDRFKLYADGALIGMNTKWYMGMQYKLPGDTAVIAIEARNIGGRYGIIGSFAGGRLVTGKSWKCTHELHSNWEKPNFDDSEWPLAEIVPKFRGRVRSGVPVTNRKSRGIWAVASKKVAFCRGYLREPCVDTGSQNP